MRKIKRPRLGEYVLATRWSDHDPHDPWYVGFVCGVLEFTQGIQYMVVGSNRQWRHVFRISKEEGDEWIKNFAQQPQGSKPEELKDEP